MFHLHFLEGGFIGKKKKNKKRSQKGYFLGNFRKESSI